MKALGSFSLTSWGGGTLAASASRSPKVAVLPEAWVRTLSFTVISPTGTFQRLAAAWTNMARVVAPALRNCSHEFEIADEPPVSCAPKAPFA